MKILFLHGWHSIVGGVKPTSLAQAGHHVLNPALDDDDFALAVLTAQAEYDRHLPDAIVGSSRGGAVALNIVSRETPLVLLCPAWKRWGTVCTLKANSVVLHSRSDEVIPYEDSEQLVADSGLPAETLIEVGSDHRLADDSSLAVMLWACELLASGQQLPQLDDTRSPENAIKSSNSSGSQVEGSYICDGCGEEIVVPLDLTEGPLQTYIEDCPVCCRANVIHLSIAADGTTEIRSEPEQDRDN